MSMQDSTQECGVTVTLVGKILQVLKNCKNEIHDSYNLQYKNRKLPSLLVQCSQILVPLLTVKV